MKIRTLARMGLVLLAATVFALCACPIAVTGERRAWKKRVTKEILA